MKLKPYPKYKSSGVDWLGNVPEGWEVKRLRRMFRRVKFVNHPDKELLSVYRDYGVIPKTSRDDNFNNASEDLSPYQLVEKGDLVLNKMKTWQGSIAVSNYTGIVSPAYFVAKPTGDFNLQYIHYLLRSPVFVAQYLRYSKGIRPNQWDLGFDDFSNIEAILPPLSEQKQIADFLDRETVRVDDLIAKQNRMIELLAEKRSALISHIVTRGLDSQVTLKDSGVKWLGEVPEHWEVKRLKNSVELERNGIWGNEPKDDENDLVCARVADFNRRNFTVTLENPTKRNITLTEQKGRLLEKGDLLLEKSGGGENQLVGCVVSFDHDEKSVCSNFVARLKIAPESDARFFVYVHATLYAARINLRSIKQNTGIQNLDSQSYFEHYVAFPPLKEQQRIAQYLEQETAKIDALTEKAQEAIVLMKEHRSSLITAAVTGKIDVCSQ